MNDLPNEIGALLIFLYSIQQFHAEKCDDCVIEEANDGDVHEFKTYLKTRPASLELNAIKMIIRVAKKYERYNLQVIDNVS